MRTAVYARVSTHPKTEEGVKRQKQDTEVQLMPLREYCANHKWELVREYVEEISAVKKRPVFLKMLEEAKLRKFDTIVVWKIDRFARSTIDFLTTLRMLDSHGIRFIAITQGIDTDSSNAAGRMLMQILASIAEFERTLISERVKAGIVRNKALGHTFGRKPVIFDMQKAEEMIAGGMSYSKVAKEFGVKKGLLFARLKKRKVL